jgi:hypothetical protein
MTYLFIYILTYISYNYQLFDYMYIYIYIYLFILIIFFNYKNTSKKPGYIYLFFKKKQYFTCDMILQYNTG